MTATASAPRRWASALWFTAMAANPLGAEIAATPEAPRAAKRAPWLLLVAR